MSSTTFSVRQAKLQDLQAILEIEAQSFPGFEESPEVFAERLQVFVEGFLVGYLGDKLMGYVCSELWNWNEGDDLARFAVGHSPAALHNINGKMLYISSIAIASSQQGKGLGLTLLLSFLENILNLKPDLHSVLLFVGEHWIAARSLYQKIGFSVVAEIPAGEWNNGLVQLGKGLVMKLNRVDINPEKFRKLIVK